MCKYKRLLFAHRALFPMVFSEYLLPVGCPHNEALRLWAASVHHCWLQGADVQPRGLVMGAGALEREWCGASASPGTLVRSCMVG